MISDVRVYYNLVLNPYVSIKTWPAGYAPEVWEALIHFISSNVRVHFEIEFCAGINNHRC